VLVRPSPISLSEGEIERLTSPAQRAVRRRVGKECDPAGSHDGHDEPHRRPQDPSRPARTSRRGAIEGCSSQTLFLVMDVVETAWNFEIEDKLGKDLEAFIG
jgi:hypothetical protein